MAINEVKDIAEFSKLVSKAPCRWRNIDLTHRIDLLTLNLHLLLSQ